MELREIKGAGYYTDGTTVFFNESKKAGGRIVKFMPKDEGSELFLKCGVMTSYVKSAELNKEVRLVESGEEFFDGQIKVVDKKTLDIFDISYKNRKFDEKGYTINPDEIEYIEKRKIVKF